MKVLFADTLYFVALFNPKDQWHQHAIATSKLVGESKLITTENVLVELLNFYSSYGDKARLAAATQVEAILNSEMIEVVAQDHEAFMAGLTLYKDRPDKGYSLTDCISMNVMFDRQVKDVLTHDEHFRQEGFNVLL